MPSIWPIAKVTNITEHETKRLQDARFKFTRDMNEEEHIDPPSSKRSKKWRHGVSKDVEKRIEKELELNATLHQEVLVKEGHFVPKKVKLIIKRPIVKNQLYDIYN